ncbi:MAG: (2Fe-2S) ferredoxin domain-containing protein [Marmoricola sp.]
MVEHSGRALVLVGMSVREASARDELAALARDQDATLAFLQLADPSVGRELTRLADAGHERIVLVGVSLGTMAPVVTWLRRIASYWWQQRGPAAPVIEVATVLLSGTTPADLELALEVTRPITGTEAPLSSPAWEDVPEHRHQVLLCRGPRCSAQGADASAEALVLALMAAGLGDDDVLVTHTGCQFPCNRSPVVSVQPDDVWYGGVDDDVARRIVAEHLVGGVPVADHRLPRTRS